MGAISGLFGLQPERTTSERVARPSGRARRKPHAARTVRPPWPCNRIPRVRPKLQKLIGDVFAPVMECAHERPLKYTKYGGLSSRWLACQCH
jgi:hypothetical protein